MLQRKHHGLHACVAPPTILIIRQKNYIIMQHEGRRHNNGRLISVLYLPRFPQLASNCCEIEALDTKQRSTGHYYDVDLHAA